MYRIPLEAGENNAIYVDLRLDKGKQDGVQVRELRVVLVGKSTFLARGNPDFETNAKVLKLFFERLNAFLNQLDPNTAVSSDLDAFNTALLTEMNATFGPAHTFTRFIVLGWTETMEGFVEEPPPQPEEAHPLAV